MAAKSEYEKLQERSAKKALRQIDNDHSLNVGQVATGVLLLSALALDLPVRAAESRGELLYSTHCIGCPTAQAHWRDKKLATSQSSLRAEVQRWQANATLQWSEEDVRDVTQYLNDTFYRFPQQSGTRGGDFRRRSSLIPVMQGLLA